MDGDYRLRAHDRDRNYLACLGPIRHRPQLTCAGGGTPARLELDKLPDGRYRATVGTLFEHQEICRTGDLEALLRQADATADDVVAAFRAMRTLRPQTKVGALLEAAAGSLRRRLDAEAEERRKVQARLTALLNR